MRPMAARSPSPMSRSPASRIRGALNCGATGWAWCSSISVEDNLKFQSRIAGRHDAAWHAELVERLGLGDLTRRYPEQLSGGQQQRVAIGRALAPRPLLLLADEPTGNLDEETADEVLALARDLVARSACGFLMVTHSTRLAATLDRRVNLHAGVIA